MPTSRDVASVSEEGLARMAEFGLKPEQVPRHIAIIMDGNGQVGAAQGVAQDRRAPARHSEACAPSWKRGAGSALSN